MRKLQQFYIGKFLSGRLANTGFEIKRDNVSSLREKQELVALADSQVLRTIRYIRYKRLEKQYEEKREELRLQGWTEEKINKKIPLKEEYEYDKDRLANLIEYKKELLKMEPKDKREKLEIGDKIRKTGQKINDMLYIPEYVLVTVESKNHYKTIIKKGLFINGYKYVRLLCSAGMARNNTVAFIREDFEEELKNYLKNGMNENIKITENKYNAYFALASTATHTLSTPKVFLVDDCEIEMSKKIDWVQATQTVDPLKNRERVVTLDKKLPFNLFDGGGLIDISKAKKWAEELELDYVPSVFIIRSIFIKGCLFTVDFKKFAKEVAKNNILKDLYGNEQDLLQCDVILTKSQFKLWNAYDSMEQYQELCDKNLNYWGISRVSPKNDDDYMFTNYQFLQVLNLEDEDIEELCKPTKEWLQKVAGLDRDFALLYLLGTVCNKDDITPEEIYRITGDSMVKALMINPEMIKDEYIRGTIIQSINKKIKEAYIGKLIIRGCFNTMIPDPYAMMEWAFGMEVKGLLNEFEHYSDYWNKRDASEGVGMRSPLTWRSEVNRLVFVNNEQTNEWYKYLSSGTIYNVWGVDCMLHADSDFDGDIVANSDNSVFVKCRYDDIDNALPITYQKNSVPKKTIFEKDLYKSDLDSFNGKIGQITNYSTSFYDLLCKYKGKTDEYSVKCYKEILERLKLTRKAQGDSIDAAKGIKVAPYPATWIKHQKINEEDTEEQKAQKKFLNDVCADKKPYFFKYRYPALSREFKEFETAYKFQAQDLFQKSLDEIIKEDDNNLSVAEIDFKNNYYEFCPIINYHSPMNRICEYLEKELTLIGELKKEKTSVDIISLMQSEKKQVDEESIERLKDYYEAYLCKKRDLKTKQIFAVKNIPQKINTVDDAFVNINQYAKYIRQQAEEYFGNLQKINIEKGKEAQSVSEMIADAAIEFAYIKYPSKGKSFVWSVFGKYIVENIKKNTLKTTATTTIPIKDDNGEIEYLYNHYNLAIVNLETIDKGRESN